MPTPPTSSASSDVSASPEAPAAAGSDPASAASDPRRGNAGGEQAAPSRRRRGFETVRDMLLSMGLVGAVVVAVFLVVAWQRPEVQGPIRPDVDVSQLFAGVEVAQPFPLMEPTGLSDGWKPTSAWFEPAAPSSPIDGGVLHVGYVTPEGSYAEVRQTDGDPGEAVAEWVGDDAERVGSLDISGRQWSVVESEESGKQALVVGNGTSTVVVTGKAAQDELVVLAESLR